MVNAFATDTESKAITQDAEIEHVEASKTMLLTTFSEAQVTRCCRRTVKNENGESWSARRCVTHNDSHIAMGRACELAQADANDARDRAHSLTVTQN